MAALPAAAAFAQAFCDRKGIDREDALRLKLVIEELFTNTVQHGHLNEGDAPVRVALAIQEERIEILYEDSAPRFDPLARLTAPPAGVAAPLEARPIGGLGDYLIGQLVASARYAYENGCNRLWLTMPRGS